MASKSRGSPPRVPRRSLLIIECDHEKLMAQSLSLAAETALLTRLVFRKGDIDVVLTRTDDDLVEQLRKLAENKFAYRRILVIGHSSGSGICLTSSRWAKWDEFARWISIFRPEILYLVGCQTGLSDAVDQLCLNLETVKEIYGSTSTIGKMSARLIYSAIAEPHLRRSASRDVAYAISAAFLPITNVVFNRWRC